MRHQTEEGFTVLEILVAIGIFILFLALLAGPLMSNFRGSSNNAGTINSVASAQEVMEQVRGAWKQGELYDRACVPGLTLPAGTTLTVQRLDENGIPWITGSSETPTFTSTCSTNALPTGFTPAIFKRLTVTSGTGGSATSLVLDVRRPGQ